MVYNTRYGQSIFDIATAMNVGIDNLIAFSLSNGISNLNAKIPANTIVKGTPIAATASINKNNIPYTPTAIFKSRSNQSIFDIAMMLTGTMDNIVSFALSNSLNIGGSVNVAKEFVYTKGVAITDWCFKNNYIFTNSYLVNKFVKVISAESGRYLTTESGIAILVR